MDSYKIAITYLHVFALSSVAVFAIVLSDTEVAVRKVNYVRSDSEYTTTKFISHPQEPCLQTPIKVHIRYNSSTVAAASDDVERAFDDLIRDTRAWRPMMIISAEDCRNEIKCVRESYTQFEVTCNGTTSTYFGPLDAEVSSDSLRRLVIVATQRCSEFNNILNRKPYEVAQNLDSATPGNSSAMHSFVVYLESLNKDPDSHPVLASRRLIRELWLDSLNQTDMMTFFWVESRGTTDELLVVGKHNNIGFFDETASWDEIERGIRAAFRSMYELGEEPGVDCRGVPSVRAYASTSTTTTHTSTLVLLSIVVFRYVCEFR